MRGILALFWLDAGLALAAVTSSTQWDVKTTGTDSNGGGFDAAVTAAGTDYSQQNAPRVSFDGISTGATTYGASATITLTGYTVTPADNGNVVNITGGAGFLPGRYTITAVDAAANTWTFNAAVSSGAASGMTGAMGGALAAPAQAFAAEADANAVWVQAGVYNTATGFSLSHRDTYLSGYTSSHGDGGRATFRISGGSGINLLSLAAWSGGHVQIDNLTLDCAGAGGSTGFLLGTTGSPAVQMSRTKIMNCAAYGYRQTVGVATLLNQVEITGCGAGVWQSAGYGAVFGSYIHHNTGTGLNMDASVVANSIIANNTGPASDGLVFQWGGVAIRNTFYGNGRDGIRINNVGFPHLVKGNIFVSNGGYGVFQMGSSAGVVATEALDGNAYHANGGGPAANTGSAGYSYTEDILLTGNPFVNADAGDFSLNGAAGAGAALKGRALPTVYPGSATASSTDLGASQSAGGAAGARAYTFVQ